MMDGCYDSWFPACAVDVIAAGFAKFALLLWFLSRWFAPILSSKGWLGSPFDATADGAVQCNVC